MRDKGLFPFSGGEDRLWKTALRCLWKFRKSECVPWVTELMINVDPERGSLNRSPNSIISSALMQVVWWLKWQKRLSFEIGLTVDVKDFIFTLEPEDNLFCCCWISGAFHSPHLICSSQLRDCCFLVKMYGEYLTITLGCYRFIFTGDLFPFGIDSFCVHPAEKSNHCWCEVFVLFFIFIFIFLE